MKKLLFICAFFTAFIVNAQSNELQYKKLSSLVNLATKNLDNIKKVDSIITEIEKFKEIAVSDEVLDYSNKALKSLKELNDIKKSIIPANSFNSLSDSDLKEFEYHYDKFNEKYFIYPIKKGEIYPYIVLSKDGIYMRFVNIYSKSNWIFWNKARFIYDEKRFEYYDDDTSRETSSSSVNGVEVTEKSDVFCDQDMIQFLRDISTAKLVEGRLEGRKGYYDYTIGEKTKLRIAKVISLYDKLKK